MRSSESELECSFIRPTHNIGPTLEICQMLRTALLERGSSVVEYAAGLAIERARVQIPFATVSKFGHFRSLHDASVDSAVQMSTWL